MDIESFSGAATVAAASTIVFALVMKSWHMIARSVNPGPKFSTGVAREAAQRFREEFDRLNASQTTYLSAALVFLLLFGVAHGLHAERLYAGYPYWQLYLLIAVLTVGAFIAFVQLVRTIRNRRQVKLLRDANIAIGHQLHSVASGFGRVYHDIETDAGIIDHLVVGPSGAYAIHVFAQQPVSDGHVRLENNTLRFLPADKTESTVPLGKRMAALERDFRRLLDHRVRVRSVIAVPGWQVDEQTSEEHLILNDGSLPMLRGWKDQADYLMNEDVDALQTMLNRVTTA
jgi:hypothetical protein